MKEINCNVLLINYSGFPDYMEYLYVDNGLAYTAGRLMGIGCKCEIMDYMTLSTAERLFPYKYYEQVDELRNKAVSEIINNNKIYEKTMFEIREMESLIDEIDNKVVNEIILEIKEKILNNKINCIGFKLWSQPSLRKTLLIASQIKKMFPKIVIFAAGAHIDYFLERVYTSSNEDIFDFCIYADGEPAIDMIPKYIKNEVTLKDIPNIVYKENGQVIRNKCERIKKLSYDYGMNFDKEVYPAVYSNCEKVKLIPVENARGCNFRCEFCIHPIKSGNYREKSINELMEELDVLNKKYGFINFYACGSNTSHKFCIDILKKVYEKGNDYILSFFQSARDFNIENRDILSKANVGFFWIGIETASQDIAKNQIKNHKKISDSELVCKLLNEIGIRHYDSYIFPMPGYNFMSADETIELINRINSEWVVIYPPLLQPRTAW